MPLKCLHSKLQELEFFRLESWFRNVSIDAIFKVSVSVFVLKINFSVNNKKICTMNMPKDNYY